MTWKYTINPQDVASATTDIKEFQEALEEIDEIWYELPHIYKENSEKVSLYTAIIVETNDIDDVNRIKEIHDIEPSVIYYNETKTYHLVFSLVKWIKEAEFNRLWKVLAFLYKGKLIDYHFFYWPKISKTREIEWDMNQSDFALKLKRILWHIQNRDNYYEKIYIENHDPYRETLKVKIEDIAEILQESKANVDDVHNFDIIYWFPYFYVLNYFEQNFYKTRAFFEENFNIKFKEEKLSEWAIIIWWVEIGDTPKLMKDELWYFSFKWEDKNRITDFFIKVYYKIIWVDGSETYIVTLLSWWSWKETKKIEWCNSTSSTSFADYIQKYWNFHFYWWSFHIKELHKLVSESRRVPIVKPVIWAGWKSKEWILIYGNWLVDVENKVFTPKPEWEDYYFNYNWENWYYVVSDMGQKNIDIPWWFPIYEEQSVDMSIMVNWLLKLYKNDKWILMLYLFLGLMGHIMYWKTKDAFPIYFIRGITQSWKTTYTRILKKMFGLPDITSEYWSITKFAMSASFWLLERFPFFISEYRHHVSDWVEKRNILRSAFDRNMQLKWQKDLSTRDLHYRSSVVIEWEEMVKDGAVRTRALQVHLSPSDRIDGDFDWILRKLEKHFKKLQHTYVQKSKWEDYLTHYETGRKFFSKMTDEKRIVSNLAYVFAGCMCYNTAWEKQYKDVLKKLWKYQIKDVQQNSTSKQILKLINSFLRHSRNMFDVYYVIEDGKAIVVDRQMIVSFAARTKDMLTLDIESYPEHLEEMWFHHDYYEVESEWFESMVEWIRIPFDKLVWWNYNDFLVAAPIFKAYKQYLRQIENKNIPKELESPK